MPAARSASREAAIAKKSGLISRTELEDNVVSDHYARVWESYDARQIYLKKRTDT